MKVYSIPDDMKNYRAPDAFQIIEESNAALWLVCFLVVLIIMEPYLK